MDFPDLDILRACDEAEQHQRELLPLLARSVGVLPSEVFYTWAFRKCKQSGDITDTDWRYFFHGLECDIRNVSDGRFLRLDFGPHGRIDTLSAWGVLQFVMTTGSPWPEFATLKALFADKPPPYDQYAGNFHRFCEYWDRLDQEGCFEVADPGLVEFQGRHTTVEVDGLRYIRFPPETTEETQVDCSVAHRKHLSARARRLLAAQSTTSVRDHSP